MQSPEPTSIDGQRGLLLGKFRRLRVPGWLGALVLIATGVALYLIFAGIEVAWGFGIISVISLFVASTTYRPALGLATVILLAPYDSVLVSVGRWQVSLVPIGLGIVAIALLARGAASSVRWPPMALIRPVAGFTGVTLVAGLAGRITPVPMLLLATLSGPAVYLLATNAIADAADTRLLLVAAVGSAVLQVSGGAAAILLGKVPVSELSRLSGSMSDPNHFAGYLLLLIPIALAICLVAKRPERVVVVALATAALAIGLLATMSRGGWLGLSAGIVVLALLLRRRAQRLAIMAIVFLALAVLAGAGPSLIARLAPHATGPAEMLASRARVWAASLAMIADHPLFGVGVGNFGRYYPLYGTRPIAAAHAHNLFLNIAAEQGIAALVAFGLLVSALFRTLFHARNLAPTEWGDALAVGLIGAFSAYFVYSLSDVSYGVEQVFLLFWLLLGVSASLPRVLRHAAGQ